MNQLSEMMSPNSENSHFTLSTVENDISFLNFISFMLHFLHLNLLITLTIFNLSLDFFASITDPNLQIVSLSALIFVSIH